MRNPRVTDHVRTIRDSGNVKYNTHGVVVDVRNDGHIAIRIGDTATAFVEISAVEITGIVETQAESDAYVRNMIACRKADPNARW